MQSVVSTHTIVIFYAYACVYDTHECDNEFDLYTQCVISTRILIFTCTNVITKLTTVSSPRTRVWFLLAECDFDSYECAFYTHECKFDTYACDSYKPI
jgi:hypothetical protein